MKLLEGKTALITGAARGIGKAVAMKFAEEGANIAFTDLVLNDDMAAGLEATRKEIEALGVKCNAYAGNAADFAETDYYAMYMGFLIAFAVPDKASVSKINLYAACK